MVCGGMHAGKRKKGATVRGIDKDVATRVRFIRVGFSEVTRDYLFIHIALRTLNDSQKNIKDFHASVAVT